MPQQAPVTLAPGPGPQSLRPQRPGTPAFSPAAQALARRQRKNGAVHAHPLSRGPYKVGSPSPASSSPVSWGLPNPRGNPVTIIALSMVIPLTNDSHAARHLANANTDGPRGNRALADSQVNKRRYRCSAIADGGTARRQFSHGPGGRTVWRGTAALRNHTSDYGSTQARFIITRYQSSQLRAARRSLTRVRHASLARASPGRA